jgi:ABC-type glycerol-3-phosphate transport system substrate-binding protein
VTAPVVNRLRRPSLTTRAELPWLLGALAVLLGAWHVYNRQVLDLYPRDLSEGGRFHVVTYGSDPNPARADQLNRFNQYYRQEQLKVMLVPGGGAPPAIITTSAALNAPDVIDAYVVEDLRTYIRKGIAVPINPWLKERGIDLESFTWPTRLDELREPNPAWRPGDPPLDRHLWYAVPNNMDVHMVFFNQTLFERVRDERARAGLAMPHEPWLDWTWWDYALLAKALHRRGAGGRFTSFGAALPDLDTLYRQVGESMRGESREEFARLDPAQRAALGLGALGWDDCVRSYRREADGTIIPYPNRAALADTMQYLADLVGALRGAPSASDAGQVANPGGFAASNSYGHFSSGLLGLHISGRWFLGQVRAQANFDWRLYRMPRWVPLAEWERWQRAGLDPADRDGPWGEREHRLRGFALPLGGRVSFISSSCRDPGRAFRFLEYLATNQDFNRILLVEDGMGADMKAAYAYLSAPDPLFPGETLNRPVAHELGTLERLYAREAWPYTNRFVGRDQALTDIAGAYGQEALIEAALAETPARIPYDGVRALFPDQRPSSPALGRRLADDLVARLEQGLAAGAAQDRPVGVAGPSWATLAFFVLVGAVGGGALLRRRRKGGSDG